MSASTVTLSRAPSGLSGLVLLCLAATWLVWGSTYLAIKYALISFPPFFQMGTRFLLAGIVLAAWMRWRQAPWPDRRQWRNAAVVGSLMLGGDDHSSHRLSRLGLSNRAVLGVICLAQFACATVGVAIANRSGAAPALAIAWVSVGFALVVVVRARRLRSPSPD